MAGFSFSHRVSGAAPTVLELKSSDTALAVGDLVNIESGILDLAVKNDTKLAGAVVAPGRKSDGSGDTDLASIGANDTVMVIVDADAVYKVADANARLYGATLDISGATGAMGVATSSNVDVVVAAPSTAAQPTLVMLSNVNHVTAGV